ncbi:MAG TPA: alpha/beta hydrolase [Burkholderiales bacterium]|nr:alpha/beta hydrolase [Burkholderiales bacterium]
MLGELLIPLGIAYGAVLVLVFLFQSHLVFFPGTGREAVLTPQSYGLRFDSVQIRTADDETLDAWWVPAEGARGVVLFFHGNAGNISHRLDYLQMFHRLRYTTLIVDYRGYGKSTGTPSEAGTYRDAEAAWEYLRHARMARPQDIVIAGESLGAAVATWLAAEVSLAEGKGPGAVLLFSTFTSVNDLGAQVYWFLPVRLLSRIGYDNQANLKRIRAPVFIAHSRDDDIVPYAHGKRLYETANEPKTFLEMRGGHNDGFVFVRPEWVAELGAFLDRLNPGKP